MPDPLTTASAFAAIVGLISNYRQEKGSKEALDHQNFVEWLEYHHHEEIKNLICNTAALRGEVDKLLRADHAIITEKLDAVSATMASLTSQIAEFRGLTMTMMPEAELSGQAVSILRQLVNSESHYMTCRQDGSNICVFMLENDGGIEFTEPRLLKDDLDKLVHLGLLAPKYLASETIDFYVTRNAIRLIEAIDNGGR